MGKLADFSVFDRDFVKDAEMGNGEGEQSILRSKCLVTVVDGVVVYGNW